jgi:hypothetical protein
MKMKFEIKHRFSGAILFSIETDSWKLAVEAAIKGSADLSSADLSYANLRSADLSYADLSSANLSYADLSSANLSYADLSYADLSSANLRYADLSYADLSSADQILKTVGERPIFQIGPIGSRADYLQAFNTDHGVFVRAGCFWDSLDKFRAAVEETHGESVHGNEYRAAITMIELHAASWAQVQP